MPKPTERQSIIANIIKNVHNKNWECIIDNCNEKAINSHLLQQNGILDSLSENGHLIECKIKDPFTWEENSSLFEMKRVGKRKAFSFPIFCSNHDTSIFREIETHPIDLDQYRVHLLLSYRAVCAEKRKKEVVAEQYRRFLKARTLKDEQWIDIIEQAKEGTDLAIRDLESHKEHFEEELENESSRFTFNVYTYPFIDIYASAIFSPINYLVTNSRQDEYLNAVFIHVIPYNDQINIIVGYCNDYVNDWITEYVDSWSRLENEGFEKKLTELFSLHIENWGMSPYLFAEIKKENLNLFIESINENAENHYQDQQVDFNLFEYDGD